MALTQWAAMWFFPFALPLCLYVAFTDLREMRITNQAVAALFIVFLAFGLIALPFQEYLWRLAQFGIVLVATMFLNYAGAMGAGDSKFIAAAAPFIAQDDIGVLMPLFAAVLLAAVTTHRLAKISPLRKLAPNWESWEQGKLFPMGMALGFTLLLYIGLGLIYGAQ